MGKAGATHGGSAVIELERIAVDPGNPETHGGSAVIGLERTMESELDAGADVVMAECGWLGKRLRRMVREALRQAWEHRQEMPADSARCMGTAWREYCEDSEVLRYVVLPQKFVAMGMWMDRRTWPVDQGKLEAWRRRRQGF